MELVNDRGYEVSDDRSRLDIARVARWLAEESYWAVGRSHQTVQESIDGSLSIGLYDPDGCQIGFCRWVTDSATFGWLCDVYVEGNHAGSGLGTWMLTFAIDHPSVRNLKRRVLATDDAHALYEKFGFERFDTKAASHWMTLVGS